jgi:hypothetical protein
VDRRGWSYPPRRWSVLVALAVAAIVAVSAATDLLHGASDAGRLSDLRSYYKAEETGVSSCAGGLNDSLVALQAVLAGASTERATAESLASLGAQACTPALNDVLFNMATSPPPRSLAGYGAATAGDDLYKWAYPDAAAAQTEVDRLLREHAALTAATAHTLYRELLALQRSGLQIQRLFETAAARLHSRLASFRPSIVLTPPASLGAS